jgi:hypothetical protein
MNGWRTTCVAEFGLICHGKCPPLATEQLEVVARSDLATYDDGVVDASVWVAELDRRVHQHNSPWYLTFPADDSPPWSSTGPKTSSLDVTSEKCGTRE